MYPLTRHPAVHLCGLSLLLLQSTTMSTPVRAVVNFVSKDPEAFLGAARNVTTHNIFLVLPQASKTHLGLDFARCP